MIRPNRFYGGKRPTMSTASTSTSVATPQEMVQRIDRGDADWGHNIAGIFLDPSLGLVSKYGVNRSRFFLPGLTLRMFAMNSSRPLFRNNPRLRKAVNFALDRQAIQDIGGGPLSGVTTDQYLPSAVPGFSDAHVYPLDDPDLEKAKALASGNLRGSALASIRPTSRYRWLRLGSPSSSSLRSGSRWTSRHSRSTLRPRRT